MDESKIQENKHDLSGVNRSINGKNELCGFDGNTNGECLTLGDALKCCLKKFAINGADKVLLDKKFSKRNLFGSGIAQCALQRALPQSLSGETGVDWGCSSNYGCHAYREFAFAEERGKNSATFQVKESAGSEMGSEESRYGGTRGWDNEYVDESEVVDSSSGNYTEFPFNCLAFFAVLLTKLMVFQFNLLVNFFTFPIWLLYISFMFLMFPFQTLRRIKRYFMKKLLRWWVVSCRSVSRKAQQSMGNIAMRCGCGLFWSSYVCLMLLGLLASGFVFGGLVMRQLVEKPIRTTETLYFDYTKTSPVAFVPIIPFSGVGDPSVLATRENVEAEKQIGARVIPQNHKLQLTLSLAMPESEYNRKLGIFQVRVEFLSARGKVTASSSQPCIMRFKSQPIHFVETIIKTVPLIAGFASESQVLNIKMDEFTEGLEPTACLKVMIEKRAEYKASAGIPEIYAASLSLESELPQLRRLIWLWRRTVYVWISVILFLTELMFAIVFCRPVIMPRGRILYAKTKPASKFISWH